VNVLDRACGGTPNPAEAAQRVEGSRFLGWEFYRSAASGSRERPMTMRVYQRRVSIRFRTGSFGKNITLGGSREPPGS
jgi:hypothetical protein